MRAMLKIRNVLVFFILFMVLWGFSYVNAETKKEVVIYTSLDQIFSEPILKEFEQEFSIRVKVVYDTEAAKTTGLVNRLIAEKDNPCADVFWNNEIARTIVLKEMGILTPHVSPNSDDIPAQFKDKDGFWTGFAARARVLIFNTNLVNEKDAPQSIFDLTNPKWKGKFCLANPLFGTTATHAASLFVKLGDKEAEKFFKDLNENSVVIVPGNSVSRDRVVEGELAVGFTDTDDAWVAISEGKPIKMVYPDSSGLGTFLIPNTVSLIKGCPHPQEGKKLIDFLLSKKIEEKLAFSPSMQIPLRKGVKRPAYVPDYNELEIMEIDFEEVAHKLKDSSIYLQNLFLK